MKNFVLVCVSLSLVSPLGFAIPEIHEMDSNPQHYRTFMQGLIEKRGAAAIAQILDVHGVLTNHSTPLSFVAHPRGHMDLAVRDFARGRAKAPAEEAQSSEPQDLEGGGVFTVFSSAWEPFEHTITHLRSLSEIDLGGVDAKREGVNRIVKPLEIEGSSFDHLEIMRFGYAVSCRPVVSVTEETRDNYGVVIRHKSSEYMTAPRADSNSFFYRYKPFSLDNCPAASGRSFDAVVFVDDSSSNIDIFRSLMSHTKWYEKATDVYILSFPGIHGRLSSFDLIEEYQSERSMSLPSSQGRSRGPSEANDANDAGRTSPVERIQPVESLLNRSGSDQPTFFTASGRDLPTYSGRGSAGPVDVTPTSSPPALDAEFLDQLVAEGAISVPSSGKRGASFTGGNKLVVETNEKEKSGSDGSTSDSSSSPIPLTAEQVDALVASEGGYLVTHAERSLDNKSDPTSKLQVEREGSASNSGEGNSIEAAENDPHTYSDRDGLMFPWDD